MIVERPLFKREGGFLSLFGVRKRPKAPHSIFDGGCKESIEVCNKFRVLLTPRIHIDDS